jgi:hypothetical protein
MAGNAYFEAMPPWHDATTGQADGEKICAGTDLDDHSLRLLGGKVAQHRFFCISRGSSTQCRHFAQARTHFPRACVARHFLPVEQPLLSCK